MLQSTYQIAELTDSELKSTQSRVQVTWSKHGAAQ